MAKIFDRANTPSGKSFRQSEEFALRRPVPAARALAPALRQGRVQVDAFNYEEGVDGTDHSKYLWGNAAYALGRAAYPGLRSVRLVRRHSRRGRRRPGGRPAHPNFTTDSGDVALKCPPRPPITDRREKELADLGFVPLVHCKGTDYAAFFSVQSAQKPKVYDLESANANARLSAQLPYILAIFAFAHYLSP